MATISPTEFQKVEMRVGKIVEVADFPEARNPSYKLRIDFGPFGIKTSSAAVQPWYAKADLLGRHVVAVTNFPPRQIGPFMSEVLCLGAVQSDRRVVLLRPDVEEELGARIA
jgi:tRNA-binding protein